MRHGSILKKDLILFLKDGIVFKKELGLFLSLSYSSTNQ